MLVTLESFDYDKAQCSLLVVCNNNNSITTDILDPSLSNAVPEWVWVNCVWCVRLRLVLLCLVSIPNPSCNQNRRRDPDLNPVSYAVTIPNPNYTRFAIRTGRMCPVRLCLVTYLAIT